MITKVSVSSESELREIAEEANNLPDDALVVDIGAGMSRLPRANFAVDLMTFDESRKFALRCQGEDRCTRENWIVSDVCDPFSFFHDKQFEYSFCSQTIEDVRDPIGIVRELNRISRRGFISTIHWTYELGAQFGRQWGAPTDEFVGYHHHRWVICVNNGVVEFVWKPPYVQWGLEDRVPIKEQMIHILWEEDIQAREIFYTGSPDRGAFLKFLSDRWGEQ